MAFKINKILILMIIVSACSKRQEKAYYDTGEIKSVAVSFNDSCYKVERYYKNGETKEIGLECRGRKYKQWKEYYSTGEVKWTGDYYNDYRIYPDTLNLGDVIMEPNILNGSDTLLVDSVYIFKVKVEEVHPEDIVIGITKGLAKKGEGDAG
ncbi:MAG: hypothetical protein ACOC3T_02710, partial [Bacteroidota bacterium]